MFGVVGFFWKNSFGWFSCWWFGVLFCYIEFVQIYEVCEIVVDWWFLKIEVDIDGIRGYWWFLKIEFDIGGI